MPMPMPMPDSGPGDGFQIYLVGRCLDAEQGILTQSPDLGPPPVLIVFGIIAGIGSLLARCLEDGRQH
jgi:hypothetical protein